MKVAFACVTVCVFKFGWEKWKAIKIVVYVQVQLQIKKKMPNYGGVTTMHSKEYPPLKPLNW